MNLLRLCIRELSWPVLLLDAGIGLLAVGVSAVGWWSWKRRIQIFRRPEERTLAASVLGQFLSLNLAAASVLATGVGWKIIEPSASTGAALFAQLSLAALWLLAAIVFGGIGAAYMIGFLHHPKSLGENHLVVGPAITQFYFTAVGAAYIMVAVFLATGSNASLVGGSQVAPRPTTAVHRPPAAGASTVPTLAPTAQPSPALPSP